MKENTATNNIATYPADDRLQERFQSLLDYADVEINGDRDWDIQVHNQEIYYRLLSHGTVGFAEAYMDGWWDCRRLDQMFTRVLTADINKKMTGLARLKFIAHLCWHALCNSQTESRAFEVGEVHYNIGNDLYRRMLDSTMSYSCGYWAEADNLEDAQRNKLELICRKLQLEPGMTLLDIGCGWGGLAEYAARHYKVRVTGITVSSEQKKLAEQRVAGLPVDIQLIDYRSLEGRFDRIASVGMFEHVGPKNYRTYFQTVRKLLEPDGLFLLHTIGEERTGSAPDPFLNKYIFPNGKVASRKHLNDASAEILRLEDWHNFGLDYDRTLMAWAANFENNWDDLKSTYSESFYRMWRYYLYACAGFFRSRKGQLWQIVFAHPERRAQYRGVR